MNNVEIYCLAKDLPEYIEVDVSPLNVGESLHLSDLKLPSGVEIPGLEAGSEHNLPEMAIVLPRAAVETEEAAPATTTPETKTTNNREKTRRTNTTHAAVQ